MLQIVVTEGSASAVFEPLFANLIAADVEIPDFGRDTLEVLAVCSADVAVPHAGSRIRTRGDVTRTVFVAQDPPSGPAAFPAARAFSVPPKARRGGRAAGLESEPCATSFSTGAPSRYCSCCGGAPCAPDLDCGSSLPLWDGKLASGPAPASKLARGKAGASSRTP